jgi:cholinesterase
MALIISGLPLLFFCALASAWNIGQEVNTSSGNVIGHASSWQTEVSEYLGIRYAQPPVGPLRFAPPRPYNGTGAVEAAKFVSS